MKKRNIYTLKMAQALINQGFEPIAQVPSVKDLSKNIWVFEETEDFDRACEEYIAKSKARAKPENPAIAKFSRRLIARMFFKQKLPVASIATITGKTEDQINETICQQYNLYRLFAIAKMDTDKMGAYMAAQTDEERMRMVFDILEQSEFDVYGGTDSYRFPDEIAKEAISNA